MKPARRPKIVSLFLLTLLILIAIPVGLTAREARQQQRNRALIAAIRGNQKAMVLTLLEQGADVNAHDDAANAASFWPLLLARLRGHKTPLPHGPSALLLALQWRPEPHDPPARLADSKAIVAALLQRNPKMDAPEILARMSRTYAFCVSYQDTGEITSVWESVPNLLQRERFQTAFARPERFFYSREDQFLRNGSFPVDKSSRYIDQPIAARIFMPPKK